MTGSLGVDVGGTFTDVAAWDGSTLSTAKVPSTPDDQSRGVVAGAAAFTNDVARFFHGTTVATNALLERAGATCALVTSPGFEDVLEIGRQDRPALYDQQVGRPAPLVPADRRVTPDALADLDDGIEAVAVSLQYSFEDPAEELAIRRALHAARPGVPVSLSSEVAPEFREFERASTTVLNAYVQPIMAHYLLRLSEASSRAGLPGHVLVMQSSGGLISAAGASRHPAAALLSGPAGGVVAAAELGRSLGRPSLISFDMGGTSTDVCRIEDGRPEISNERLIDGYPCRLPAVAVHTVGAGGGSLGWIDSGGALRVGPRSAGAQPGPACYGRGGVEPAVTDANLVLGRINPAGRLGSDVVLEARAAHAAISRIGEPLGLDNPAAAVGMIEVVEEVMAGALRTVSVEQGADPREATLVSFGGAGGLHGSSLARRLDMAGMIVPLHAGVFSAFGLLLSPPRQDWSRSVLTTEESVVDDALRSLGAGATDQMTADGLDTSVIRHSVDMRYVGQSHELTVPYEPGSGWNGLAADFHALHATRNGFSRPTDPVEAVTVRVEAVGEPALRWGDLPPIAPTGTPERGSRPVQGGRGSVDATVWWRPALRPGAEVIGPAVIEEPEATTFLGHGERAVVHDGGALVVDW
ncbi:MAG: hydantoinase/oxoprolinase family protein [Acidimicrobiia bacterium]|nr:hydantoinase/oxoprolinase family protein [Acidimicrobiia bacterium]NNL71390.1 hydantoinase/oxoprolinase family protein [Acidimicrobiia bacterium]